jgi:hypothetical protein
MYNTAHPETAKEADEGLLLACFVFILVHPLFMRRASRIVCLFP